MKCNCISKCKCNITTMNRVGPKRWETEEDVLQDLGIIGQGRINDYLVIGSGPPPPLKDPIDETEYQLRYGNVTYSDETIPPDLGGIQQYLRMVSEDEESTDEGITQNSGEIVISKLNPLVKEFVPKSARTNCQPVVNESKKVKKKVNSPKKSPRSSKSASSPARNSVKDLVGITQINTMSSSNSPNVSTKCSLESSQATAESMLDSFHSNGVKSPSKGIQTINEKGDSLEINEDVNIKLDAKEIVKKTNELRNKISKTLKCDSPKLKKERNVAIANLLKLHSAKPSPCSSRSNISSLEEKEIKLFTPDYFKNTTKDMPSSSSSNKKLEIIESKLISEEIIEAENDEKKDINTTETTSNGVETSESTANNVDTIPSINVEPVDPSIQESIDKVNNWFEKPESPKVKIVTVCMGPVSFKRKDAGNKSTNGDVAAKSDKGKSPVSQFKPSKYADDLAKKYMERSQENEQRESLWDNLERELKKKDKLIRKNQSASQAH